MSLFDKARRRQQRAAAREASASRPPPLEPEPEPTPAPPHRELHDPYYSYQPSGEQYHRSNGAGGYHPNDPFYNVDDYRRQTYTVNPPPNYSYPYGWEAHDGRSGVPGNPAYSHRDYSNNYQQPPHQNNPPPGDQIPPPHYSSYPPGHQDPNGQCFIM